MPKGKGKAQAKDKGKAKANEETYERVKREGTAIMKEYLKKDETLTGFFTLGKDEKYDGEWKDGKINGHGIYTWADGRVYDGMWKDGKCNGRGVQTWASGEKYDGEFKDDKKHGQGTHTWADGAKYVGQYEDDERNGKGVYHSANGVIWDGEFKNGTLNGTATMTRLARTRKGKSTTYVGEWKDGRMDGYGVMTYGDGDKYKGQWKDGLYHGEGIFTSSDGYIYEGRWENDKRNGKGVLTMTDGRKYDGEWKDGMRDGHGVYTFPNGVYYDGEWENGKKHGQGTCYKPGVIKHEGTWNKGEFCYGKITHIIDGLDFIMKLQPTPPRCTVTFNGQEYNMDDYESKDDYPQSLKDVFSKCYEIDDFKLHLKKKKRKMKYSRTTKHSSSKEDISELDRLKKEEDEYWRARNKEKEEKRKRQRKQLSEIKFETSATTDIDLGLDRSSASTRVDIVGKRDGYGSPEKRVKVKELSSVEKAKRENAKKEIELPAQNRKLVNRVTTLAWNQSGYDFKNQDYNHFFQDGDPPHPVVLQKLFDKLGIQFVINTLKQKGKIRPERPKKCQKICGGYNKKASKGRDTKVKSFTIKSLSTGWFKEIPFHQMKIPIPHIIDEIKSGNIKPNYYELEKLEQELKGGKPKATGGKARTDYKSKKRKAGDITPDTPDITASFADTGGKRRKVKGKRKKK